MSAVPHPDRLRDDWLNRLSQLIRKIQAWADALGWHVHYMFPETPTVGEMRDADAKPLSRDTLQEVLEALKHNAVQ